jgi:hypothetical protein
MQQNVHGSVFFVVWAVMCSKKTFGTSPVSGWESFEGQGFCFACDHGLTSSMVFDENFVVHFIKKGTGHRESQNLFGIQMA